MIVKFCLPILYFWMGYNAIEDSLDLWIFLKRTVLICVIYSFLIGGVSAKLISPLYGFLCFGTGGTFVAYASLADFYAILIGVPVMLYIFTSERKFLYAAGLLFLSLILESVRTGIGASILGLHFCFLAYKKRTGCSSRDAFDSTLCWLRILCQTRKRENVWQTGRNRYNQ